MAEKSLADGRGYGLGERNPTTLPGGPSHETEHENERNTRRWRPIVAWACKPGGKY